VTSWAAEAGRRCGQQVRAGARGSHAWPAWRGRGRFLLSPSRK